MGIFAVFAQIGVWESVISQGMRAIGPVERRDFYFAKIVLQNYIQLLTYYQIHTIIKLLVVN